MFSTCLQKVCISVGVVAFSNVTRDTYLIDYSPNASNSVGQKMFAPLKTDNLLHFFP